MVCWVQEQTCTPWFNNSPLLCGGKPFVSQHRYAQETSSGPGPAVTVTSIPSPPVSMQREQVYTFTTPPPSTHACVDSLICVQLCVS